MTIIISMAGLSSRFTKSGYVLPKYMLYVLNRSLFNITVNSFKKYFLDCNFLFIARNVFDTKLFIDEECKLLNIKKYSTVILDKPTSGQAETVFKGVKAIGLPDDESILIFNIDTIRPNYIFPENISEWDGYLEVFKGSGSNWSYAKTENDCSNRVIETAEKKEISDNCSTGLYYFKRAKDFISAFENDRNRNLDSQKELYVAPLYNILINKGSNIHINVIDRKDVIFCGVPDEYITYLKKIIKGT